MMNDWDHYTFTDYLKHGCCALIWCVTLPFRILLTVLLSVFAPIAIPVWLLMDIYNWACAGNPWECLTYSIIVDSAKGLYWDFLVKGKFNI